MYRQSGIKVTFEINKNNEKIKKNISEKKSQQQLDKIVWYFSASQ